ncbi:hypothetical protein H0H92_015014 [Tricholoma furcatifolium]|nr:hypothetical protein H0H92_015014 [Tricholoma furcatifolium]
MSASAFTAISVASIFLTRPFVYLGIPSSAISKVSNLLHRALAATGGDSQTIYLRRGVVPTLHEIACTCDPEILALMKALFGALPPANDRVSLSPSSVSVHVALALVCHYFHLTWDDWFLALGGTAFKLVLRPTTVYVVKESDGYTGVVWTDHSAFRASLAPLSSAASEMSDSDDADNNSSRPSSRLSTYSFSSRSSASSHSSIVSASSFPSLSKSFSLPTNTPPVPASKTPTQSSFIPASTRHTYSIPLLAPITNESLTRSTPRPAKSLTPKPTTSSPNCKTKYLYQGGVSNVLTGGVMLGPSSTPTPDLKEPPQTPRHAPLTRSPARA